MKAAVLSELSDGPKSNLELRTMLDARLSADGLYRYSLVRIWNIQLENPRVVLWVMLNPSTADAIKDDPTIRRCIGFAKSWGHDGIEVVNLFAYRSRDPKALRACTISFIGPENDDYIHEAASRASLIVAAWGAYAPGGDDSRARHVSVMLGPEAKCLGLTARGRPLHPLYVPAFIKPTDWNQP